MAKNYKQPGKVYDYTAGADITSGSVVIIGTRVGVALADIANGDTGPVQVKEVFELPKLSTDVIAQGALVYWDTSPGEITTTASGNTLAGVAALAAGDGATKVWVDLNA